jgi:hypothetical protein
MTKRGAARAFFEEALTLETDECILWPFYCDAHSGMPKLGLPGQPPRNVARLACERIHGPCPPGMMVLHSRMRGGHSPQCINHRHLRWGTALENVQDRDVDGRPHRLAGVEIEAVRVSNPIA